ncbi:sporulation histidine kinase inhibitor Sda [Bacillus sp. CGMCC 1.16607]
MRFCPVSSFSILDDQILLQTYDQAKELNLDPEFISILELEILSRHIAFDEEFISPLG